MYTLGGIAAAFVMPQNQDIDMGAIMIATAPVKFVPWQARKATSGYIFGQALQHWALPKLGVNIPDLGAGIIPGVGGKAAVSNGYTI